MTNMANDHFRPKNRRELLNWYASYRPAWEVKRWSKAKLFAVYYGELDRYKAK